MGIYLDHQTTTPPLKEVHETYAEALQNAWGAVSAPHRIGQSLLVRCKDAYRAIYNAFGVDEENNFIFTSSGAEAINHIAFATYMDVVRKTGKNHLVTSMIDEAPNIMAFSRLERDLNCLFTMAKVDEKGQVTAQSIEEVITPRTALVSLSWGCGLTGVIHPIEEIIALCRERGILVHIDATHVFGKMGIDFESLNVDFLSFNGDQLFAPKGTGGFFTKKNLDLSPLILGGSEQAGYRGGTLNIPGLLSLGVALTALKKHQDLYGMEVAFLRNLFEEKITKAIEGSKPLFHTSFRLPHISCLYFPRVTGEAMAFLLNERQVYASFGGGMLQQIGNVLLASQKPEETAHSSLSFGLSHTTQEEEIEKAIEAIIEAYAHLAKASLYLQEKL